MHCCLLARYDRNHLRKIESMFKKESLVSRILRSKVSNAFLKSIKGTMVSLLLFILVPASSINVVMALVVESPCLKPNCLLGRRLFDSR